MTATQGINKPLFIEVLALIEADNGAHWDQGNWARYADEMGGSVSLEPRVFDPMEPECGTAFCFAGWATVASRKKIRISDDSCIGGYVIDRWESRSIEDEATELLFGSLTPKLRGALYLSSNSKDDLYNMVALIFEGRVANKWDAQPKPATVQALRAAVDVRVKQIRAERAKRLRATKKELGWLRRDLQKVSDRRERNRLNRKRLKAERRIMALEPLVEIEG